MAQYHQIDPTDDRPDVEFGTKTVKQDVMYRGVEVTENGSCYRFLCPCSERIQTVRSPPFEPQFNAEDLLTLGGSVSAQGGDIQGLCHFLINAGLPTMCDDATCPGKVTEDE